MIVENCLRRLSQAGPNPLPLKERMDLVLQATREVIRPALYRILHREKESLLTEVEVLESSDAK